MRVPFFDLSAHHTALMPAAQAVFARVLASGRYILGPEVREFEREAAEYLGVSHAIGVSSGTDALVCALTALGVGNGDTVLTTPFTFFATVEAILRVGARPQFCDIDPESLNWSAASLSQHRGRVQAAIVVHLFGRAAPLNEVRAALPGVPLIEDAAQAWGASTDGKRVGSLGNAGCFSFFPSKPLGCVGDGGLIVTQDHAVADRCRQLRSHGAREKYVHQLPLGGNYRLDELQAGLLRLKLPSTGDRQLARREIAKYYTGRFRGIEGLAVPPEGVDEEHAWSVYTLKVRDRRDGLAAFLAQLGIETSVYYPSPVHLQPALSSLGFRDGAFPVAERAAQEVLALPVYPELSREQQAWVADSVCAFFAGAAV